MRVNKPFSKEIAYGVIKTLQRFDIDYNKPVKILRYYVERLKDDNFDKGYEGGSIYRFTPDRFKFHIDPQVYRYNSMTESWLD